MRNNLKKIKGLLTKFKGFEISSELDRKILKAINNAHVEREFKLVGPSFFTYLSNLIRHKMKRYAVTIIIAVMAFGGVMYFNQNSYVYHLALAKNALSELQLALQGNPNHLSFIPGVYAEESATQKTNKDVDEAKVTGLSKKVIDETDAAIDAAEHLSKPSQLKKALNEINDVQLQSIDVLSDAVEAVNSDEATKTMISALNTTTTQQDLVNKAIKFTGKAVDNKEDEVSIDVETSSDIAFKKGKGSSDNRPDVTVFKSDINEVQAKFDEARKEVLDLKSVGAPDEELVKLESKLIKAKTAITDGKLQRAHGLTTAVHAKSRNIVRKAEKMAEKALEKDSEDSNKSPDENASNTNDDTNTSGDKQKKEDDKISDNSISDDAKNEDKKEYESNNRQPDANILSESQNNLKEESDEDKGEENSESDNKDESRSDKEAESTRIKR